MMFILGEADYRTPPGGGGEQMFRALKYRKIPTVMVMFPNESHELSRSGQPWHRIERLGAHRRLVRPLANGYAKAGIRGCSLRFFGLFSFTGSETKFAAFFLFAACSLIPSPLYGAAMPFFVNHLTPDHYEKTSRPATIVIRTSRELDEKTSDGLDVVDRLLADVREIDHRNVGLLFRLQRTDFVRNT